MARLKQLVLEIHRRSVWQVLGIYLIGGWAVWKGVGSIYEYMGLPDWVPATALVILIAGLPLVVATAFVQEGGPPVGDAEDAAGGEKPLSPRDASATGPRDRPEDEAGSGFSPLTTEPPEPRGSAGSTVLTWNRAVTSVVLAFALLGLAATGFMGMRWLGIGPAGTLIAKGMLEPQDRIVLADFPGTNGGGEFAGAVRTALRADLEASPVVELLDDGAVERSLRRMEVDPADPLTSAVARELALREGLKATLEGDVSRLGDGWVITARIVGPRDGETLASFRETADGQGELIDAVDRLSRSIRGKVGEALNSARAGEPLEQVTTSSLEALRLYAEAEDLHSRRSDFYGAVLLLERALELDPTFAMAWRKLGVALVNAASQPSRWKHAMTRAFELRDRLSERERLITESTYYYYVKGDTDRSIRANRTLLDRYPGDVAGHVNLIRDLLTQDRYGDVTEAAAIAVEAGLDHPYIYIHAVHALWLAGEPEEARAMIAEARTRLPKSPLVRRLEITEAATSGDYARADSLVLAFEREIPDEGFAMTLEVLHRAWIDGVQGRFEAVEEQFDSTAPGQATNIYREALASSANMAVRPALQLGALERTRRALARALEAFPLDSIPVEDRSYLYRVLAWAYAHARQPDQAEEMLSRWAVQTGESVDDLPVTPALIRLHTDPAAAAERARPDDCVNLRCLGDAAEIMMRAGRADSALVLYTRYVESNAFFRLGFDAVYLPIALERLGQLYEERGRHEQAAEYYARFIDLWSDGDPVVQPRVDAARRALARLTAEGTG